MSYNDYEVNVNDNGSININPVSVLGNPTVNNNTQTSISVSDFTEKIKTLNPTQLNDLSRFIEDSLDNGIISATNPQNTIVTNAVKSYFASNSQLYNQIVDSNITASTLGLTPLTDDSLAAAQLRQDAVPYNPNSNTFDISNNVELTRQTELAANQRLLNPKAGQQLGTIHKRTGSLQDVISGSDLSVFFLAEIPKASSIKDPKYLQEKELVMIELDSVMQMSYSILREVFPVRALGISKPKSFTRGPTAINGYLSFSIFTEDVLSRLRTQLTKTIEDFSTKSVQLLKNLKNQQQSNTAPQLSDIDSQINVAQTKLQSVYDLDQIDILNSQISDLQTKRNTLQSQLTSQPTDKALTDLISTYNDYKQVLNGGDIYLLNQLMPFHLLVMGTNEQGILSKMMIKGIRVIDENQMQGVQQPNIVNRITFAAEDIYPLVSNSNSPLSGSSNSDQNNISANKFSIYTGSQLMQSIVSMVDTTVVK